jgi:murein peptide amidase A
MIPTYPVTTPRQNASSPSIRSLDAITAPLSEIAARSSNLIVCPPGRFELAGQTHDLPRYLFLGPAGGAEPIRIGIFAGLHGDEPASAFALLRFIRHLDAHPEIARGYCLFLYPVCNPTGFENNTRFNRNDKDLNREFWRNSRQPEVRLLESELMAHAFHGIVSFHTDDTSHGIYGYAHGAVITRHLLRPALVAASEFLPLNDNGVIDGFPACDGIIRDSFAGILRAPPSNHPRPFEIILETPHAAPQYLQETALAVALRTILDGYRGFIAHAANL